MPVAGELAGSPHALGVDGAEIGVRGGAGDNSLALLKGAVGTVRHAGDDRRNSESQSQDYGVPHWQ